MDLDIQHICRICLEAGTWKPIFVTKGTFGEVISCAEMITTCASVTVSEEDKLPQQICNECLISLKIAYKFKKTCESSHNYLISISNELDNSSSSVEHNQNDCELKNVLDISAKETENNNGISNVIGEYCDVKDIKIENDCEDDIYVEPVIEIDEGEAVSNSERLKHLPVKNKNKTNRQLKRIRINQRKYGYYITRGKDDVDLDPEYLEALYRIYKHRCDHCPRIYAVSTYFTVHVNAHLGIRPYHCEICNKNYPEERTHLKYHKQRKVKGSYPCEMCEKSYNSESSLRSHMKKHTGEVKWHPCSYCPLKYDQLSKLKNHVAVHTREKNMICKYCQKAFRFDRNLRVHILSIHSSERPHKCAECGKGFVTGYDLSMHKRKHLGIMNHQCQMCTLAFFSSSELRGHTAAVHSKKNAIACKICGACYARKCDLNKHMVRQHPDTADEEGIIVNNVNRENPD